MDIDAFVSVHEDQWQRMRELTSRRYLSGSEVDELVLLYQRVASHLSALQSRAPDPTVISRLSTDLATTRARIAGAKLRTSSSVAEMVRVSLPAALYRIRWWTVGAMSLFLLIAFVVGVNVAINPSLLDLVMTTDEQMEYVYGAFESYYDPGVQFAAMVWTNNAWIALQCVAFGISGVWPVFMIVSNAINLGMVGGLMASHGQAEMFFMLITPHGLMEMTAIFVAAAAGLRLFWTLVDPGPLPRGHALAREGRALFLVALGLVGVLAVSGLIEGFVTGSTMNGWLKIAIGAAVLATFWWYTLVPGKRAAKDGETGDYATELTGDYFEAA